MVNSQKGTTSYSQIADADPSGFEPTVFGAIRRHRVMVIAVAVLATLAAVGYARLQPKVYSAQALITMPQTQGLTVSSGQYLDSQVILLQSQNVAQLAATIANAELPSHSLTVGDFFGSGRSLRISPPLTADVPGAYGATVVGVSFAARTAQAAQVGINAVVQAYDQTRSSTIKNQANEVIAGIDDAINNINRQLDQQSVGSSSTSPDAAALREQLVAARAALVTQRAQATANEQIDLAQQPTVATDPPTITSKWALDGGIGLIIGILIGGALAYVLDSRRRRSVAHSEEPSPKHGFPPLPMSAPSQQPPRG